MIIKSIRKIFLLALIFITSAHFYACSHYDEIVKNKTESKHYNNKSHNMGQNCMQCHRKGGEADEAGEYLLWNIGGTIYKPDGLNTNPNGWLYLYTQPNGRGELKYSLEVDAKGNVYTNQIINFASGLFPLVVSSSGDSAYMSTAIPDGKCNNCHGVSTSRITVE